MTFAIEVTATIILILTLGLIAVTIWAAATEPHDHWP
jgi:hypothetical protein